MTPEQREQMQKMQQGMVDLQHLAKKLAPDAASPDAPVSLLKILRALASCPIMGKLPNDPEQREAAEKALSACTNEVLGLLENKFVEAGALEEGALKDCEAVEGRNTLFLYWHLYQSNMPELLER